MIGGDGYWCILVNEYQMIGKILIITHSLLCISAVCDPDGLVCRPECNKTLHEKVYTHPCMADSSFRYMVRARLGKNVDK